MMTEHNNVFPSSGLDEQSKSYLMETTKWTQFLAVLGFIGTAFMVLIALFILFAGGMVGLQSSMPYASSMGIAFMGIIYLIFAVLYVYPILCLYKFTRCIKQGIRTEDQGQIIEAFRYQRNMYRFIGVLMIILLAFYVLAAVFGILGSIL